jgi:hypothetical protein
MRRDRNLIIESESESGGSNWLTYLMLESELIAFFVFLRCLSTYLHKQASYRLRTNK